ncbi:MAG: 40S ribosomal protein S25 [Candidatus Heimdallarchaeota archaeon]|nr:40S ribosomal protein S25 [Candidatus Heimdallarchaeota archaeon]MCK4770506.1 40S ribosomal protein S25 [Candidatus Heimdallarchaeota archaeon]
MSAERKVVRKKKKFGLVVEFIPVIRDLTPDDDTRKKIDDEIKRAKGITPSYLADRYNIRVSTAKKILQEAEANNIIKKIITSRRTKVYSATAE